MGRSRGGLTTKLHLLAEGRGRSLVTRITPGQAADTKELVPLVDAVAVPRPGGHGRHRKRLDRLTADKAYGSKANRRSLRARGITHTIPERDDVVRSRARKGSRGGRPPTFNPSRYKARNQVERAFNRLKQFRAVDIRYDKLKRPLSRHGNHRLDHDLATRPTRPRSTMIRQIRSSAEQDYQPGKQRLVERRDDRGHHQGDDHRQAAAHLGAAGKQTDGDEPADPPCGVVGV
jgi:transposase